MSAQTALSTTGSGLWAVREACGDTDLRYLYRRWAGYFGADGWRQERQHLRDDLVSTPDDDNWAIQLVAEADGRRVGGAVGWAGAAEHLPEMMGYDRIDTSGRAGYLTFATVAPGYRGRGIHAALVRERVQALAPDVDRLYTTSWVREDHPDSTETYGGGRWNVVDYVAEFYRDQRPYCPDCGRDCECDAIVWVLSADAALDRLTEVASEEVDP